MKQITTIFLLLFGVVAVGQGIEWKGAQALDQVKNNPSNDKMVIIDVYTSWCGWCKRMDATTFKDPEVVKLINDYFVAVKMDGEDRNTIDFAGKSFKYVASGRRGYNELPATLLQGKLSYPTLVFLDEKTNMLQPIPGYQTPENLKPILTYIGQKKFKEMSWQDFVAAYD